jgi:DNA processing protein
VDERVYWVLLTTVSQIGPSRLQRLLEQFGSAEAAWAASPLALAGAGLDRRAIESLVRMREAREPEVEWQRLERLGISVVTLEDPSYPSRLREVPDAPPVLYVKGELTIADDWAVAVVGTRRMSAYGRNVTERLVADLARAGVTVVSGLAKGIDTIAHRAALAAGGRTLAVLGSGLDRLYPEENRHLAAQIVEQDALVTEFPLGPTYPRIAASALGSSSLPLGLTRSSPRLIVPDAART